MFDPFKSFENIRQIFASAITPLAARPIEPVLSMGIDSYKATRVDAHQAMAVLPVQLHVITKGQTVSFQRKALEYFQRLVSQGKIDPKTVTPQEFVAHAVVLAASDLMADGWAMIANHMLAMHQASEILAQGRRDRNEREDAMYELQQLQLLALAHQDSRTTQQQRDYVTLTRKARETQA